MRTRSLSTPVISLPGSIERWICVRDDFGNYSEPEMTHNIPVSWDPSPSQMNQQVTVDETHNFRNISRFRGSSGDIGGPFDSQKWGLELTPVHNYLATAWRSYTYVNPNMLESWRCNTMMLAMDPTSVIPSSQSGLRSSEGHLDAMGSTAIARCKPTNHVSNLANDLYEIHRGQLPSLPGRALWKSKVRRFRSLGNEYLNKEFGWDPLVADIHSACYAAANSHRLMKEYEDNSGKLVRRKYAFPSDESVELHSSVADGFASAAIFREFYNDQLPQPQLLVQTRVKTDVWFSGSFTYYIPNVYLARNAVSRAAASAAHLLGLEPTPEVIWNCAPWTWAIDWFSNAGDCISILSDMATDGLVLNYGYIMEHVLSETTFVLAGPTRYQMYGGGQASAGPVRIYYESKRRLPATPFGFEMSWEGLSLRQLAISAALGLTKKLH